jgi:hypothetical protein
MLPHLGAVGLPPIRRRDGPVGLETLGQVRVRNAQLARLEEVVQLPVVPDPVSVDPLENVMGAEVVRMMKPHCAEELEKSLDGGAVKARNPLYFVRHVQPFDQRRILGGNARRTGVVVAT